MDKKVRACTPGNLRDQNNTSMSYSDSLCISPCVYNNTKFSGGKDEFVMQFKIESRPLLRMRFNLIKIENLYY